MSQEGKIINHTSYLITLLMHIHRHVLIFLEPNKTLIG